MKSQNLLILLLSLLAMSCSKIPSLDVTTPKVSIVNITSDGGQTFTVKAEVEGNALLVQSCGFYCSEMISFANSENYSSRLTGNSFAADITLPQKDKTYYICAYVSNGKMEVCSEAVPVKSDGNGGNNYTIKDLSSAESANCYIISESGKFKFRTVKGNSDAPLGSVSSCEVLWESFGTSLAPSVGDLVKSVSYSDGYITFETSSSYREGNAVIAAKDASGEIVWSWHIWFTDRPQSQTYNNGAGVMMDRNLGATSATPGDVGSLGLLYQWGRKDPFLGSSSISDVIIAESTIDWPSSVVSSSSTGKVPFAISHPTTYIVRNTDNYDWYYTGLSSTDNTRWLSSKTIHDPCPAGWRVPDGGGSGIWSKACGESSLFFNWNPTNFGIDFSQVLGSVSPIWYPSPGYYYCNNGSLLFFSAPGTARYWSVSPNGNKAYALYFSSGGYVHFEDEVPRSYGLSVRCLKE